MLAKHTSRDDAISEFEGGAYGALLDPGKADADDDEKLLQVVNRLVKAERVASTLGDVKLNDEVRRKVVEATWLVIERIG